MSDTDLSGMQADVATSLPRSSSPSLDSSSQKGTQPSSKVKIFLLLVILLIGLLSGLWISKKDKTPSLTSSIHVKPLKHIKVQLSWFNTAEFAGFYVAQDKGFYKQAGLDVQLMEANPPQTSQDVLIAGKAEFAVAGIDGIMLARESGHPVKALAAIYQQSPVTFIALKSSGIEKPQDFIGKRVTIECGSNAEYQEWAVLRELKIDTKIIKNCSTYNIDQLLNHNTDVFAGFVTNESILLDMQGYPVNNILVTDYGVNYYPNLIFTSEKEIQDDRETIKNFIHATIQGYSYALAHPAEAVDDTMKRKTGLGTASRELQTRTMAVQSPLIYIGKTPLGWMDKTVMVQGIGILLQQGIIKHNEDASAVYTNEFVSSQ